MPNPMQSFTGTRILRLWHQIGSILYTVKELGLLERGRRLRRVDVKRSPGDHPSPDIFSRRSYPPSLGGLNSREVVNLPLNESWFRGLTEPRADLFADHVGVCVGCKSIGFGACV